MQHGALRFGEVRDLTDGSSWGGGLPVSRKEEKATRRFQPPPPLPSFPIRLTSSRSRLPPHLTSPRSGRSSRPSPPSGKSPKTLNKSSIGIHGWDRGRQLRSGLEVLGQARLPV